MPQPTRARGAPGRPALVVRNRALALAAIGVLVAAGGGPARAQSCAETPTCAAGGWRDAPEPRLQAGPRPDPATRPGVGAAAGPGSTEPRAPGAVFDRDGRFRGALGGPHPFDARIDAPPGGAAGR